MTVVLPIGPIALCLFLLHASSAYSLRDQATTVIVTVDALTRLAFGDETVVREEEERETDRDRSLSLSYHHSSSLSQTPSVFDRSKYATMHESPSPEWTVNTTEEYQNEFE